MTSGANEALELEIQTMLSKNDIKDLTIRDQELGAYLSLITKDLGKFSKLKILRLERCKIQSFQPAAIPENLKHISLQGNRMKNIDDLKKWLGNIGEDGDRIHLLSLDLSGNLLT